MKNYSNFREYFSGQLWAIKPEMLSVMSEILQLRINGTPLSAEEIQARIGGQQRASSASNRNTIAVLPLYGVIDQKVSMMQQISGGTSIDQFMNGFRSAMADDSVKGIIFDVDSPGGAVAGVPEAAQEILSARGTKPIMAVANTTIASAAYWIASAADSILGMPSSDIGSIGILSIHNDVSKAQEMEGIKPEYITSAKYKTEAFPGVPLSEDARAYRQAQVTAVGDTFTRFLGKARNIPVDTVRAEFGQGRMLLAKEALAAKMIDEIGTMEDAFAIMSKGIANATAMHAEAEKPSVKVVQATEQVLVGLDETLKSWDGLVDRRIADGKPLSKAKQDSILQLQSALGEGCKEVERIMAKIAAPVVAKEETVAIEAIATKPIAATTNERARLALTMSLRNHAKIKQAI